MARAIEQAKISRLTIDVDGTVVSTGLAVESAMRGYNPHHRKVPSYYPITAYEAQSGQILRVRNRSGNVHDGFEIAMAVGAPDVHPHRHAV